MAPAASFTPRGRAPWVARVAVGAVILIGLSSAPFISLSRWVTEGELAYYTWPYRVGYGVAAALGALLFVVDVAIPLVVRNSRLPRLLVAQLVAVAALAAWAVASIAWSDTPDRTSENLWYVVGVLAAAVWFGLALDGLQHLVATAVATNGIVLVSLVVAATSDAGRDSDAAWIGLVNNPNTLNPLAGLAILCCVALAVRTRSMAWRVVLAAVAVADVVAAVKSSSSTGWMALAAGVLAAAVLIAVQFARRDRNPSVPLAIGGVAALVAAVAPWVIRPIADGVGTDLTGRTVIWGFLTDRVGDDPALGYGWESFWNTPGVVTELGTLRYFSEVPTAAHSTFYEVLISLGVVGAVLLSLVVAASVGRLVHWAWPRATVEARWWVAVAAFALVENLTESMIGYHSPFWLLLIAAGFATWRPDPVSQR